jgi:hypothetical protein
MKADKLPYSLNQEIIIPVFSIRAIKLRMVLCDFNLSFTVWRRTSSLVEPWADCTLRTPISRTPETTRALWRTWPQLQLPYTFSTVSHFPLIMFCVGIFVTIAMGWECVSEDRSLVISKWYMSSGGMILTGKKLDDSQLWEKFFPVSVCEPQIPPTWAEPPRWEASDQPPELYHSF